MKVSVTQEKLAKALNLIKDIASSRNELPILNNICFALMEEDY